MTHLAIARKWRPQVFEDIVGQHHVTRTLQNAIRLDRVHHAFLFTGARGVGKTSAARVLARTLNCENRPETANPCNECTSCKEMLTGSYPDVVEIDAASHNSVDDIRDLVEKARYTPQRGGHKVYIIDEVHMVSKQGFNALLKTLEEPPAHVIFILATTDPQKLLDTVISRCQRFDFKMIPIRTVYEHLKHVSEREGVGIPDGSLMTMAREGGGSMRDAQSLLDQVLSFSEGSVSEKEVTEILGFIDRSVLYEALAAALGGDAGAALEVLGRVRLYGYDVRSFSNQLLEAVRNVLVVRLVSDAGNLMDLPDEEISRLQSLAKGRDPSLLRQQFDCLAEAVDAITRSEQPLLLLEMAVVKMAAVRPFVPIDKLLDRLENLEQRLARAGVRPGGGGTPPSGGGQREPRQPQRSAPPPRAKEAPRGHRDAPLSKPAGAPPPSPPAPAARAPQDAALQARPKPQDAPLPARPPKPQDAPLTAPAPFSPAPAPKAGPEMVNDILGYSRGGAQRPTAPAPRPSNGAARPAPPDLAPRKARGFEPSARLDPARPDPPGNALCDAPKWRQFVHALSADDGITVLRGMLARGGFLGADDATIHVGFTSQVTLKNVLAEIDDDALKAAARSWFGKDVTIACVIDADGASGRSLAEELDRIRAEKTATLRADALASPAVANTLDVFPGAAVVGEPRIPDIQEISDVH